MSYLCKNTRARGRPRPLPAARKPTNNFAMKITVLGPAHPFRGGLASIMEIMARTFQQRGNEVDIRTFTVQYPSLLFPGKSQTVSTPPRPTCGSGAASTR